MTDPTPARPLPASLNAVLTAGLVALALAAPARPAQVPTAAQAPAAAEQPLPSVAEVLRRQVEAMGGEAAIRGQRHVTWKGKFEMPGMGLEGAVLLRASAPNLVRVTIEVPGLGQIEQGFDGTVGWSDNPGTGPALAEGDELEMVKVQSDFYAELDYDRLYDSIEMVGRESFAGEPCYRLALRSKGGLELDQYYSIESGLLVGLTGQMPTPMGKVFVETEIGGYRELGGRLFPTVNRQRAMGAEQVLTLEEADFSPIDPGIFALPDSIRTLVDASR